MPDTPEPPVHEALNRAVPDHTPGPWMWSMVGVEDPPRFEIRAMAQHGFFAEVFTDHEADARLIAAAPNLLAALERARQHLTLNEWVDDEGAQRRFAAVKEVEAALAKAKEDTDG